MSENPTISILYYRDLAAMACQQYSSIKQQIMT